MGSVVRLALVAFIAVGCGAGSPISPSAHATTPDVASITAATVGLYRIDSDGDTTIFCAGVWVGELSILTAAHCLKDETEVYYGTQADQRGYQHAPRALHIVTIKKTDDVHDLALLSTAAAPRHPVAEIGPPPPIAEEIRVIGHTNGLGWSFARGWVSAYREEDFPVKGKRGPFMQVAAPIGPGNSGGGAFDSAGRLVGIVSFSVARAPFQCSFLIHADTLREFIRP